MFSLLPNNIYEEHYKNYNDVIISIKNNNSDLHILR